MSDAHWYCLTTLPKHEALAAVALRREVGGEVCIGEGYGIGGGLSCLTGRTRLRTFWV